MGSSAQLWLCARREKLMITRDYFSALALK
jgi:hypothetical protein